MQALLDDQKRLGQALCIAVIALGSFLFFFQLGEKPFWDYDEAIYATVIRDTGESGNALTLMRRDRPWFEKPPLYFWTSMAAGAAFEDKELAYRLTAALGGVAVLVLTMAIAYEVTASFLLASLAGFVLLAMGPFVEVAREVRLDTPVVASILFAVYSFLRGQKSPAWFLGVGIAVAIGFLFKSVIALLAGVFVLLWSLFYRDIAWIKSIWLWAGAGIGMLLLLPWHIYETVQYGSSFWNVYFFRHAIGRISDDVIGGSISALGYIQFFLKVLAPWSVLSLLALPWLGMRFAHDRQSLAKPALLFLSTGFVILLLFLFSTTRIVWYLLPAYPFLAIGLAIGFSHLGSLTRQRALLHGALSIVLVGGMWNSLYFAFHIRPDLHTNDMIVADEYEAGRILAANPQPREVNALLHDFFDTIEYYSEGREMHTINLGQPFDHSFYLITPTSLIKAHPFDDALVPHIETLFEGQMLTLYRFTI